MNMKNILILSGDYLPDSRFVQLLKSTGCRVITESDGHAMLSLLADGLPVDLVVADHETSVLDDHALLQYLRFVAPHTPVVFLSASVSFEAYLKALSLCVFEYLQKPVGDYFLSQVVIKGIDAACWTIDRNRGL